MSKTGDWYIAQVMEYLTSRTAGPPPSLWPADKDETIGVDQHTAVRQSRVRTLSGRPIPVAKKLQEEMPHLTQIIADALHTAPVHPDTPRHQQRAHRAIAAHIGTAVRHYLRGYGLRTCPKCQGPLSRSMNPHADPAVITPAGAWVCPQCTQSAD